MSKKFDYPTQGNNDSESKIENKWVRAKESSQTKSNTQEDKANLKILIQHLNVI